MAGAEQDPNTFIVRAINALDKLEEEEGKFNPTFCAQLRGLMMDVLPSSVHENDDLANDWVTVEREDVPKEDVSKEDVSKEVVPEKPKKGIWNAFFGGRRN